MAEKVIKDVVKLTGSSYISFLCTFASGLVVRRFLGPATMGLYSELMLILHYSKNHHLGILNSLDREIPFFRGREECGKVQELKDIGFTICLATSILASVILISLSFFLIYGVVVIQPLNFA